MELRLYDSYSRSEHVFEPLGSPVGLYACGPTVYDYAHIGNLRAYVFEDARQQRDFGTADALRAQILEAGFDVDDLPDGPRVRRRS